MSPPERTEGIALEAGLLRSVQEEKIGLLQDYETKDQAASTPAPAKDADERPKRTRGWKIVMILVVGLLVGSALTKTTVMHCRRPAPPVVAVILEKESVMREMPDKFWEDNFQEELVEPFTLYKRQAGTAVANGQQGANGGNTGDSQNTHQGEIGGTNPNTPPVVEKTVTSFTTLTSIVTPGQPGTGSSPVLPNTTSTPSSLPPTTTSTRTHSSTTSTTISTPTSKSTSSSIPSSSSTTSSSSSSTSSSMSTSSSSPPPSTTTTHSTSAPFVTYSSVPPPPPPAVTSEPAPPPPPTTEPAHETITTGDVTTTQPITQESVQSLVGGGVTTVTHTTWVVYIPAKQTAKDSTLQNVAPGKSVNGFAAALIGALAGLILL